MNAACSFRTHLDGPHHAGAADARSFPRVTPATAEICALAACVTARNAAPPRYTSGR